MSPKEERARGLEEAFKGAKMPIRNGPEKNFSRFLFCLGSQIDRHIQCFVCWDEPRTSQEFDNFAFAIHAQQGVGMSMVEALAIVARDKLSAAIRVGMKQFSRQIHFRHKRFANNPSYLMISSF